MNMDGARILIDLTYLFCQPLYGTFSVFILRLVMNMDGARILIDLPYLFCQPLYGTFSVLIRVPIAIISFISFPCRDFRCAAKILSVSAKSCLTVLYRFKVLNFFPFL